ncbi:serine threonine-protein kinase nek5 [Stylonychia lemnae]|uniref:Serine threonine-protein kinase nek5 n=1 Tax=Stylonychia lemnae TaxID=5949 RepID=A0A078AVB5_STYLE|nr:serine threonine-protein kinase nek5 [Stylonychia lemnae]|eukprot:CDW85971.1 serine threonine-protein kinase nek5 [Stylonychia lemnae]
MENYVALSVKQLWDKYKFQQEIDSGAFGVVYKVKNTQDNKFYAMKVQNLERLLAKEPNNISNEMVRIIREINTFKLSHANITKFYESYFTFDDQFAIITELAEQNLRKYRDNTELTNAKIADIMMQITKGTIHIHNQNVMHRDLSPDNILVFENGQKFKICDFGLSQLQTNSKSCVGKPQFNAPEMGQCDEFSYNSQVDIWSLGMILFYLCTKKYKYQGKIISELKQKDQTMIINLEGERKEFEHLLNEMLQFNPANNQPLDKHLEIEEAKQGHQSSTNYDRRNAFALTIQSHNAIRFTKIQTESSCLLFNMKMVVCIKVNMILQPINEMEEVDIFIEMEKFMMDCGRIINKMDKEDQFMMMEVITLVSGRMIKRMDLANIMMKVEAIMRDIGQIIKKKGWVCINALEVINTMDNG